MASRDAAELFLFQYDEANRILHGKDLLGIGRREEWEAIEGTFRRALKYIVELMCIRRPSERSRIQFVLPAKLRKWRSRSPRMLFTG